MDARYCSTKIVLAPATKELALDQENRFQRSNNTLSLDKELPTSGSGGGDLVTTDHIKTELE